MSQIVKDLLSHVQEVGKGQRKFESAAQGVSRMTLELGVKKITSAGKPAYDYPFFRQGKKHIIGWHEEINAIAHFVKDAAEGGSASEMALVLVGEPGNGKTFVIDYICEKYRRFLARPENRKYTFSFTGLDKALEYHPKVSKLISATFEDPMILLMNIYESNEVIKMLSKLGLSDKAIELLFKNKRPLGASTEYLWRKLIEKYGDINLALKHIEISAVPMSESMGTITGKYSPKDKITTSSVDLIGEESIQRNLLLPIDDPNRFDLQLGAIARVGGGGILFTDEFFRNKEDILQIFLQVINNRNIENSGYKWPIDTLILGTSNNDVYNQYVSNKTEAPIIDRCRICYVSHNTNYLLQDKLTSYAIGTEKKTTIQGENLHEDPNLNYAISVSVVLTRLPHSEKLTPIELMKLSAGEIAGEKGIKTLLEVIDASNANPDVTKRWGQKGIGYRNKGRAIQLLGTMTETNEGKCLFAKDVFKAFERIVLDYVDDAADREKYMKDLKIGRGLYRERVRTAIFNALREDSKAIRTDVMNYIYMVIGRDAENLGPDKSWRYIDPQTKEERSIKIDDNYINSVEKRMGLSTKERQESHRTTIRKIYVQKISTNPEYDFTDNQELVKAVTDVKLESDVAGASSLVGALANRTNEDNNKLYNRMIGTMQKLGFCNTCALKTIEYFCEKDDES
jgi:serine protein kinase